MLIVTGRFLRRSSATALADTDATLTTLKRQYRWKSDTVALGYIDQSKQHKMDVAKSLNVNIDSSAVQCDTTKKTCCRKMLHLNLFT